MLNLNLKDKAEGTITVYLSLILLLILSFILTIVEGARVNTAKIQAERSLTLSMDSVLAEYYGPLWDEYHIFGYYIGDQDDQSQENQIKSKLEDYMGASFQPDKNLKGGNNPKFSNFNKLGIDKLKIKNKTALVDYHGELMINEAVEYMKYKELGNGLELLLNRLSLLEEPQKISYIYEKKQGAEDQLVEIDRGILELMELLDGLKTSESGIVVTKEGKLTGLSNFVKMLCFEDPTMETVGINHKDVFNTMKKSYQNPSQMIATIITNLNKLKDEQTNIDEIDNQLLTNNDDFKKQNEMLKKLNGLEYKSQEEYIQITSINKRLENIDQKREDLNKQRNDHKGVVDRLAKESNLTVDKLEKMLDELEPIINKARSKVNSIIIKVSTAKPILKEYKDYLYGQKESIDQETFMGLEEDLKELEKYTGTGNTDYNFTGMNTILDNDLKIISKAKLSLKLAKEQMEDKLFEASNQAFTQIDTQLQKYRIKGLELDYSTLVLDKTSPKDPMKGINNLIQARITSLVMEPDKISDARLTVGTLPSDLEKLTQTDTESNVRTENFFKNIDIGNISNMGALFNSFGSSTDLKSIATNGLNKGAEKLLFLEYLKEHFSTYNIEDEGYQKPSALKYEQEYLLIGEQEDSDNLDSVITRIALLRTIIDFVSLIKDGGKRSEARALAAALVGFTGLPILIGVTQGIILLAWSFAEALLDVCTLMMGKELPIFKKNVVLELPELFLINRSFLQEKAKKLPLAKELCWSYQDYINIFLFMKNKTDIVYHEMDLIQENIKIRYDTEKFKINRCLYGFETEASFVIPSIFTSLGYMDKRYQNKGRNYSFRTVYAYSY